MPTMVRPKGKAQKVAFSILGTPDNLLKPKKKKTKTEQKINAEESDRVK